MIMCYILFIMETLIIFCLLVLLIHYYNSYKLHKQMHKYYKKEAKKNFDDFTTVVKHNYELEEKLNSN